eukprot:362218-Chlamydomonas_euryale.AAC.2
MQRLSRIPTSEALACQLSSDSLLVSSIGMLACQLPSDSLLRLSQGFGYENVGGHLVTRWVSGGVWLVAASRLLPVSQALISQASLFHTGPLPVALAQTVAYPVESAPGSFGSDSGSDSDSDSDVDSDSDSYKQTQAGSTRRLFLKAYPNRACSLALANRPTPQTRWSWTHPKPQTGEAAPAGARQLGYRKEADPGRIACHRQARQHQQAHVN